MRGKFEAFVVDQPEVANAINLLTIGLHEALPEPSQGADLINRFPNREIINGLRDGVIDCISTDHAPHTDYEKDKEFDFAPNGIIGLETALPISLGVLVRQNKFKLPRLVDLMTRRAAEILQLRAGTLTVGEPADICLFDPAETWRYETKAGFSKSTNSPWDGQTLTGRVKTTIVEGRIVFANHEIIERS